MKKNLQVTLACLASLVLLSTSAFAQSNKLGSECGLTDYYGDVEELGNWDDAGNNHELTEASDAEIKALPTILKQQLIIYAKLSDKSIKNTIEAVNLLRDGSDMDTLFIFDTYVGGKLFTLIRIYPGDNPYAAIFAKGSRKLVAEDNDGTIVCAE